MVSNIEISSIWLIYLFAFCGLGFAGYSTYKVTNLIKKNLKSYFFLL